MRHPGSMVALVVCVLVTSPAALGQDLAGAGEHVAKAVAGKSYSPYAGRAYPTAVLWGDTHLHTALSVDAGAFGNRLGLDEAYRFARGEEVVSSTGQRVRLLVNATLNAGYHEVTWDGRNDAGALLASGIYIYRFEAEDFVQQRKMMLLK